MLFFKSWRLGALIFGLVVIPGFSIDSSIQSNMQGEAKYTMAGSDLAILNWVDPDEEKETLLQNISEINSYTEGTIYKIEKEGEYIINLLGIENPSTFLSVIDSSILRGTGVSEENVLALEGGVSFMANKKFARKHNLEPGDTYDTSEYAAYPETITFINSFTVFPATPIPRKDPFSGIDMFSMITEKDYAGDFVNSLGFDTTVDVKSIKFLRIDNNSAIPVIQEELESYGIKALTQEEYFNELYSDIDEFINYNLILFGILACFTLLFIGYFTGQKIFEERIRIIEALYRVGSDRGQIIGLFTFEMFLTNLLPMIVTVVSSLYLLKVVSFYVLGYRGTYYPFHPGVPIWMYFVVIIGGLAIAIVGWLLALLPSVYRYRPIKQE